MSHSPSLPDRPRLELDPEMSDAERLEAIRQHYRRIVQVNEELEDRLADAEGRRGDLKDDVKGWIDENMDHAMLVRHDDPLIEYLEDTGEPYYVMDENPTAEAIAREIYEYAESQGHPVTSVKLWETGSSYATYAPETER